ncbi:SDR family NAD(P)-dependent oxidoreductase [Ammoniphilus sp. 3BR4]|uniref:SDR family NAD(P)-dependent oxidoreductase n=1 Tax=Ammoniphilus sp. 3BR4 TaxID=3158265 RepID=UPI003466E435
MIHIDLSGQVALVTGGERGIGASICRTLAQAGATVWIQYTHSENEADKVCADIRSSGGSANVFRSDISQPDQVREMVDSILNREDRIDILVNNAEVTSFQSILELTTEQWDRVLNVNLDGPFLCCKEVLPTMVNEGYGVVVNISSTSAMTGGGGAHYAASKSGLDSMTRALAREYASRGIRVNGLAPAMIESDFFMERISDELSRKKMAARIPVGRLGTPEEVAYMTAVLCSPFAGYLSGETIVLDGGRMFA